MNKFCHNCNQDKALIKFAKDKTSKDGYNGKCKICTKIYRDLHKERAKEKSLEHYNKNKEEINAYHKEHYIKNKSKKLEYSKIYNKQKNAKPEEQQKRKEYNELNKEQIKIYSKSYNNKEYKINPSFKIRKLLISKINQSLKKQNTTKRNKSLKYLGCSKEEYKQHLEQQFLPEMNWSNHGSIWEIDHKQPLSSFDLTKEENIYKAFNYLNTEPRFITTKIAESFGYMNHIGNRNKSNKILI